MISSSIGLKRWLFDFSAGHAVKTQIMSMLMSARSATWSPGIEFNVSTLTPPFGSTPPFMKTLNVVPIRSAVMRNSANGL